MKNFILFLLVFGILFFGCTGNNSQQNNQIDNMAPPIDKTSSQDAKSNIPAKEGDVVSVDYLGTLDNGTVFDTSIKEEAAKAKLQLRGTYQPLKFIIGQGTLIPGFENAIIGMKEGEDKTVRLAPNDAYGQPTNEMVVIVNKSQLSPELQNSKLIIGGLITTSNGGRGVITNITNTTITVDFNHPLAGKTLTFKLFLRKILRE